ncbi:hypothetical protein GCM10027570_46380 [Streptomonospora sediminis]
MCVSFGVRLSAHRACAGSASWTAFSAARLRRLPPGGLGMGAPTVRKAARMFGQPLRQCRRRAREWRGPGRICSMHGSRPLGGRIDPMYL